MGKLAIAVLVVLGISVALTIHTEGIDRAYGGFFAGFLAEPAAAAEEGDAAPSTRHATGRGASAPVSGTDYGKLGERIRGKLGSD